MPKALTEWEIHMTFPKQKSGALTKKGAYNTVKNTPKPF